MNAETAASLVRATTLTGLSRCLVFIVMLPVWWAVSPSYTAAETSRAEITSQEQAEKDAHLRPEKPSIAEKTAVWVERSPLFGVTSGPYPWFESIYPGTRLGLGVGYVERWPRHAFVDLLAAVSFNGSTLLHAHGRLPTLRRGLVAVELDARHILANHLSFFGLGPNSVNENPVRYDYRPADLGINATLRPVRRFELNGGYQWLSSRSKTSGPERPAEAPGLGDKLWYHVFRAGAVIDWRTSPGYSTSGGSHRLTWSQYYEAQDHPFSFGAIEYEGIQLVPILRDQWVLAARVLATVTLTDDGDDVPVVLMPTLGGPESLRGFETRRFTDRNRLLLVGEYRWRPSRWIDMAVFYDAGKVTTRRGDLGLSNLENDWGIGARFHGPTAVIFRTEVAKGREGWRINLSGGRSF